LTGKGKRLCLERGCKDWGAIAPQVGVSNNPDSKQTSGYFSILDLTQIFE